MARTRVRSAWWCAFALIAALIAGLTWWMRSAAGPAATSGDAARPELAALIAAVGRTRPILPRLTGGFLHAEPASATRGAATSRMRPPALAIASATLEQIALTTPGARASAALATARLIGGDADAAVATLESLLADDPRQPAWWSDLAAAYLVRGAALGKPDDRVRALDAAMRARELSPALPEARFNAAQALEENALHDLAAEEWRAYLAIERDPAWSGEGAARLQARADRAEGDGWPPLRGALIGMSAPLDPAAARRAAEAFGPSLRALIEEDLLPDWGDAILAHGAGGGADAAAAGAILARAALLARALEEAGGDRMAVRVCAQLAALDRTPPLQRLAARGFVRYRQARRAFAAADYRAALPRFLDAERDLAAAGSPFQGWARVYRASAERSQRLWQQASDDALQVARFARAEGFTALHARAAWTAGLAASELGDPEAALRLTTTAATEFERIRESEQAGAVASTAADLARTIGDRRQSWRLLAKALDTVASEPLPVRRYLRFYNAALFARRDRLQRAALAFQDQAVAAARACAETGALAQAFTQRAAILLTLDRADDAAADLDRARDALRLARSSVVDYVGAELDMVTATLVGTRDPARARALLAAAGPRIERASPNRLPEMRLLMGRAALRLGRTQEAIEEFSAGLAHVNERRPGILDEQLRMAFFGVASDLYGELLAQALREGRVDEAFAYSDRARGRTLLDAYEAPPAASGASATRRRTNPATAATAATAAAANAAAREKAATTTDAAGATRGERAGAAARDDSPGSVGNTGKAGVGGVAGAAGGAGDPTLTQIVAQLAALRAQLPAGTAFVEYALWDTQAIAWIATSRDLRVVTLPLGPRELERLATRMTAASVDASAGADTAAAEVGGAGAEADAAARQLHAALLAPLRASLQGVTLLIVSPDGPLHRVPFAALLDANTGRRLIEDYAIQIVPSLTWFADARARWLQRTRREPLKVLAIGNPAFDRTDLPDLADLPAAAAEARAIAAFYRRAQMLLGAQATPSQVRAAAADADVIHFGGHAVANEAAPERSYLALAPEGDGGGRLLATTIAGLTLARARLVVLAACSTARGPIEQGEGVLHLARPFLLAGVPAVVGTLWDVEDTASRPLIERFHALVSTGLAPPRALQRAQIAQLHAPTPRQRHWRHWAAFVIVGGATSDIGDDSISTSTGVTP